MNAMRAWISDDAPGLARTMAALDKGLARAEKVASGKYRSNQDTEETAQQSA